MPIGTVIGFLIGAVVISTILLSDARIIISDDRKANQLWIAEHRSRYIFWWTTSLFGLAGTFIEMLVS